MERLPNSNTSNQEQNPPEWEPGSQVTSGELEARQDERSMADSSDTQVQEADAEPHYALKLNASHDAQGRITDYRTDEPIEPRPQTTKLGVVRYNENVEGHMEPVPDAEVGIVGLDTVGGLERKPETRAGVFDLDALDQREIFRLVTSLTVAAAQPHPDYSAASPEGARVEGTVPVLRMLRNDLKVLLDQHTLEGGSQPDMRQEAVVKVYRPTTASLLLDDLMMSGDSLAARIGMQVFGEPILKERQDADGFDGAMGLLVDWMRGTEEGSQAVRDAILDALSDLERRADWLSRDVRETVEGIIAEYSDEAKGA